MTCMLSWSLTIYCWSVQHVQCLALYLKLSSRQLKNLQIHMKRQLQQHALNFLHELVAGISPAHAVTHGCLLARKPSRWHLPSTDLHPEHCRIYFTLLHLSQTMHSIYILRTYHTRSQKGVCWPFSRQSAHETVLDLTSNFVIALHWPLLFSSFTTLHTACLTRCAVNHYMAKTVIVRSFRLQ